MTLGPRREAWVIAIGWALLAVAVRIAWLSFHPPVTAWDGDIYSRTAERIAHGLGFVDTWNNRPPWKPTAFYPVGYPATLAVGYRIFGAHAWVAGALNVLAGGLSTLVIARIAARAWGAPSAHVAGALYALSPGAIAYSSAFMTEGLSAAVLCAAVAAALHHARTGRVWSALAAGALLGFGALVRPPALVVAPALALVTAPIWSVRSIARTVALVGVACACVVLPWTARNCEALDGCALVSVNGGSNLWIGTDPSAHGGYRDLHPNEGCDGVHGEVAKDRCYQRLAVARIAHAPLAWLALVPAKLGALLGQETSPVAYLRDAARGPRFDAATARPWFAWLTAWHRGVLALALAAVALALGRGIRRAPRELVAMVVAVAALIAVHLVFFGVDRYHMVFAPLLCAIAGSAVSRNERPVR